MNVTPEKRMDTKFRKRLKRRFHYGEKADIDVPSLPLTELSVNYFHDSATGKLGQIDMEMASNIVRQNKVTPCSMVVSVLYARRLRQRNTKYLDSMSTSDVFFISMMMASKYMYDEGTDDEVYNDEWAASVDQEVCDVNKMEMDFLQALDWRLYVDPHEFQDTLDDIEKQLALKEGLKRGWFTYAELDVLMGPDLIGMVWADFTSEVSKVLATLATAYLTGVLSMLGSVAMAIQVASPLSSAAVALMALNLQPSSKLAIPLADNGASLLPIPQPGVNVCGFPDSTSLCHALFEESSVKAELDINHTDSAETEVIQQPTSTSMPDRLRDSPITGGVHLRDQDDVRLKPEDPGNPRAATSLQRQWNNGKSDHGSRDRMEDSDVGARPEDLSPSCNLVTSPLWSVWFLDALLSQIWSQYNPKPTRPRAKACWNQRRSFKNQVPNLHDHKASSDQLNFNLQVSSCESELGFGNVGPLTHSSSALARKRLKYGFYDSYYSSILLALNLGSKENCFHHSVNDLCQGMVF